MKKLLLIDDSPTVQKVMSMSLMANGFAVTVAGTAAGGLDLARREPPEAIVLDVNLPDGSGLDLLARMKEDPAVAGIPVVMLTGQDDMERAARGMELGARGFLPKHSTSPKVLVAKLREILGG